MRGPFAVFALLALIGSAAQAGEELRGKLSLRDGVLHLGDDPCRDNEHAQRLLEDRLALSDTTIVVEGSRSLLGTITITSIRSPRPIGREGYVLEDHRGQDGWVLWAHEPEVYRLEGALLPLVRAHHGRQVVARGWLLQGAEQTMGGRLLVTGLRARPAGPEWRTNPDDEWITDPSSERRVGSQQGSYQKLRGKVVWDAEWNEFVIDANPGGMTRILSELERWPMPFLGPYEGLEIEVVGLLLPPRPGALGDEPGAPRWLPKIVVERLLSPQRARLTGVVQEGKLHTGERALALVADPDTYRHAWDGRVRMIPGARLSQLLARADGQSVRVSGWVFLDPDGTPSSLRPTSVRMEFPVSGQELSVGLYDPQTDEVIENHPRRKRFLRQDLRFPALETDSVANAGELTGLSETLQRATRQD